MSFERQTPPARARSWLFVPGTRPERYSKARMSGADQVILDLEDSVAPADKDSARRAVANGLDVQEPVLVRINACDALPFENDLQLADHPGLRGFIIPKAETLPRRLIEACSRYDKVLIPLVETARGFAHMAELARTPTVERLAFGSIDFQLDLDLDGDEALNQFRSQFALVTRLTGIAAPLDGVTVEIHNGDMLRRDALRARSFGFGGKLCIHPVQVALVNEVMSPNERQLAWARAVLTAAERAGGGVLELDGQMIDEPVIARARRTLA